MHDHFPRFSSPELTCLYSSRVIVPSLSVSCMLNKTAEKQTKAGLTLCHLQVKGVEFMQSTLRRTSQFLSPGLLTLLFCHVRRWRPKMGHDHHELFKANLLNFSLAILMEVSKENSKSDALKCTDNNRYIKSTISSIIFHLKCKTCL